MNDDDDDGTSIKWDGEWDEDKTIYYQTKKNYPKMIINNFLVIHASSSSFGMWYGIYLLKEIFVDK